MLLDVFMALSAVDGCVRWLHPREGRGICTDRGGLARQVNWADGSQVINKKIMMMIRDGIADWTGRAALGADIIIIPEMGSNDRFCF